MAKKAVATLQTGDKEKFVKVIKMVKSPKTGAYMFAEEMRFVTKSSPPPKKSRRTVSKSFILMQSKYSS